MTEISVIVNKKLTKYVLPAVRSRKIVMKIVMKKITLQAISAVSLAISLYLEIKL